MNVIDHALDLLAGNPDLTVLQGEGELRVEPLADDGFLVQITEQPDGFTVFYEGWHEDFEDADTALRCFAWGLSAKTHLKVESAGGRAYRWTAETFEDGEWGAVSTTGLLFWPFWRRSETNYLQNNVVSDPKRIG